MKDWILLISGDSPCGATKHRKVVSFIGMKAWLLKGCFSIILIFIGKVLFKAEKTLTIVLPPSVNVSTFAKLSNRFAYPSFIFVGSILSVDIKSPYELKFDLFIFIGLTIFCQCEALMTELYTCILSARMIKIIFTFFMLIHNSQKLNCLNA